MKPHIRFLYLCYLIYVGPVHENDKQPSNFLNWSWFDVGGNKNLKFLLLENNMKH